MTRIKDENLLDISGEFEVYGKNIGLFSQVTKENPKRTRTRIEELKMTDQEKSVFEEWFKTSNIGRAEKHIALAAWEAGVNRSKPHFPNPNEKFKKNLDLILSGIGATVDFKKTEHLKLSPGALMKLFPPVKENQSLISQHVSETKHSYFFVTHKDRSMFYTCSRCGQEFER